MSAPVYVAGLERSGTSLMYALLASHPRIAMTRRTNLWRYFFEQYGDLSDASNRHRCLEDMKRYKRLVVLDLDWSAVEERFADGPPTYPRLFASIGEHVAEREGKPRWGDKSLLTERFAAEVFDAFPNACIVHMMRDPRDRFASVIARWRVRRGGVGAGTAEWLQSARLAERNSARFGDRYLVVRYEDLVTDPPRVLRRVCDAMGETYDDSMLDMAGAAGFRDGGSNSSYGKLEVGHISTASIGRYTSVLSPTQIRFVDSVAGDAMRELAYERARVGRSPAHALRFATVTYPLEVTRMMAWRLLVAIRSRRTRGVPDYRLVDATAGVSRDV